MLRIAALFLAAVAVMLLAAHLALRPPPLEGRTASRAAAPSAATALGRVALSPPAERRGDSGVVPLLDGPDAFAARIALIRAADVALDVQYYIWQRDAAGLILLDELRHAAKRGVRVRLLLDDNGIAGLDPDLAALDAMPNVEGRLYADRLRRSDLGAAIASGTVAFEWTEAALVSDDPAKGLGEAETGDLLFPPLMELLSSVDLVLAYFVPGRRFTEALADLARSGTRVRILTNAQDATDVIVVHSADVTYRPELLRAGVELYELKPTFAADAGEEDRAGTAGSSRASLHSKTVAVDGAHIFIGSFNFDPRSFALNTEMGVLIESPRLAGGLARAFAEAFPVASYRPVLTEDGSLVWEETTPDGDRVRHAEEPGSTAVSRALLSLLGLLPIEWLL